MMKKTKKKLSCGFTLVELILAMIISSLLITAIMTQADSTLQSTRLTVERQNEQITRNAFFTLMKDHFEGLPGNCRLELTFSDRGQQYLSDMTFQNVPTAFNWGSVPVAAEAMRMSTIPLRDGGLDIVLEYFDEPILDSDESLAERGIEPLASITLLQDVRLFEWRVYDNRNRDEPWVYEWDIRGRLPTQVELNIAFGIDGEIIRRVFWIPARTNPQQVMRSFQNQGNSR
jgi:prepilin-type N-terminal cleavage/methylation domain-containing protein